MRPPSDIIQFLLKNAYFADPEAGFFVDPETGGYFIDPEAGVVGGDVFVSFLPDQPDEIVGVFDTTGRPDGRIMRTGERIEHPGVQIQVRGKNYSDTWQEANGIALFLDGVKNKSVVVGSNESYVLHNVTRIGTIIPIGLETVSQRRRHLFTINMIVTLSENTN